MTVTFLDYLFKQVNMYKLSIHDMVLNSRDLERTEGKSCPSHYILSILFLLKQAFFFAIAKNTEIFVQLIIHTLNTTELQVKSKHNLSFRCVKTLQELLRDFRGFDTLCKN